VGLYDPSHLLSLHRGIIKVLKLKILSHTTLILTTMVETTYIDLQTYMDGQD